MDSRWKVICNVCGRALYNTQAKKRWDGLIVCPNDWEEKHPSLHRTPHFRRRPGGEGATAARSGGVRSEPPDQSVLVCDVYTSMGVAGYGTAGCARAGSYNTRIPLPPLTPPYTATVPYVDPISDPYLSSVVLLLNGHGTNGSQVFTDLSIANQTVYQPVAGNRPIWTSAVPDPYGNPSISFDTDDFLKIDAVASLTMGLGDFTWEGWFRCSVIPAAVGFVLFNGNDTAFANRAGIGIGPTINNGEAWYHNGSATIAATGTAPSINTWHYFAYSRDSSGGKLWVGDTPGALCTLAGGVFADAAINYPLVGGLGIGGTYNGSSILGDSWLGPIRITKGVARYPTGTIVPETPFSLI